MQYTKMSLNHYTVYSIHWKLNTRSVVRRVYIVHYSLHTVYTIQCTFIQYIHCTMGIQVTNTTYQYFLQDYPILL